MHTLTMVVAGLIVLAAFWAAGRMFGEGGRRGAAQGVRVFLPAWLAAAIANLAIGYYFADVPLLTEIAVFVAVFGIPAAAAITLLRSTKRGA